ncbi:hypothetical protein HK097_002950, partial [Rhizophlyctis rosea]
MYSSPTVRALASELNADVLILDYATLLSASREVDGKREPPKEEKPIGSPKNRPLYVSSKPSKRPSRLDTFPPIPPAFAPYAYTIYDPEKHALTPAEDDSPDVDNDPYDSEDDYGSEDEYDDDPRQSAHSQQNSTYYGLNGRPGPVDYWRSHIGAVVEPNSSHAERSRTGQPSFEVQFAQDFATGGNVGGGGREGGFPIRLHLRQPNQLTLVPTISLPPWYSRDTHYEEEISDAKLQAIKDSLLEFAFMSCGGISNDKLPTNLRRDRRLVIFLKDTTDILEMRTDGAKKLILRLLEVVGDARGLHKLPITLIAGCTPSLLNTENLGKGTDFYRNLFDGAVVVNDARSGVVQDLWESGRVFRTVLDGLGEDFEKVEMVPPATSLIVDKRKTVDGSAATTQGDLEGQKARFEEWLRVMEEDEKDRVIDVNWGNVEACCHGRGIQIRGIDRLALVRDATDRNVVPDGLVPLIEGMMNRVWSLRKVERLVSLALGVRLELSTGAGFASVKGEDGTGATLDLTARHFAEGLRIMEEGEGMRS